MTNEKAIMCLEDMKIKVPIPKAAKQARENNEALDVAIKALQSVNNSENPNSSDAISRQQAIDAFNTNIDELVVAGKENADAVERYLNRVIDEIKQLPPIQPKRGKWILDRSGTYCCSECMEPCAGYVMMKPRDKFCKMCGSRNEVTK